jgi:hypothetical protein
MGDLDVVARALRELPEDHPARLAFAHGQPLWMVARCLKDRPDLYCQLLSVAVEQHKRFVEGVKIYLAGKRGGN